ncbi:MAG: T9SS type A sorting domain-containing protein [Ignavibacteriales bacterium]|nr:T9SS type A sorting domain-containing protein [Ignavibacteriales bacterium]
MKLIKIKSITFFIISFTSINLLASLSNHPSSFKETVVRGGTKTVELHISNSISSPLGYSFTIPVSWVKASLPTGSVNGNATLTVILAFDASNLIDGKYNITISLNDPHHGGLSIPIELTVATTTGINEENALPNDFKLLQNYPNPFNPSTTISFSLPKDQNVSLIVYDLLGKQVQTLVNKFLPLGNYSVKFDAADLPSGIYFYRIQTEQFTQVKKMILTK